MTCLQGGCWKWFRNKHDATKHFKKHPTHRIPTLDWENVVTHINIEKGFTELMLL